MTEYPCIKNQKSRNKKQMGSVKMLLKNFFLWPKFSDIMNTGERNSKTPFNIVQLGTIKNTSISLC